MIWLPYQMSPGKGRMALVMQMAKHCACFPDFDFHSKFYLHCECTPLMYLLQQLTLRGRGPCRWVHVW
jgi:hypothetical protein